MSERTAHNERFGRLVNAALDQCIGEADWAELRSMLKADPAARAAFRRSAELHAMLRWDAVHAEVAAAVTGGADEAAMAIVEPGDAAAVAGRIGPKRGTGRRWAAAALGVAAAIAAAASIVLVMRSVEPADADGAPRGPALGVVLDTSGVRWTSEPIGPGGDFYRGELGIADGRLDLELHGGVSLSMTGAGSMHVMSGRLVRLDAGTLHAVVPAGAEGFTVEGPHGLRVVDLGTAFTVTVDSDAAAFVAVNAGRVRVELGAGEPVHVDAGFVASVSMPETNAAGELIAAGSVHVTPGDRFRALAHRWTFNDGSSRDEVGAAHGQARGGAIIADGALRLDGVDDCLITDAAISGLRDKTLVAWVSPATLDQRGGGVLSVQTHDTADRFDAIVYGELTPRLWMAGSDGWARTQPGPQVGTPEDAAAGDPVMIAIAWDADGLVRLYREGVLYGSYKARSTLGFDGARALMGLRHADARPSPHVGAHFAGLIDEARIYGRALDGGEIAQMHEDGPMRTVAGAWGEQEADQHQKGTEK